MTPAYEHNDKPVNAQAFYEVACDPRRHVAVEACAGAGKTWMLVSRIVRALLDGAAPQEILAITFTKRAAGEMRERLQQWLAEFSKATPKVCGAPCRSSWRFLPTRKSTAVTNTRRRMAASRCR